jgi:heme exporter protein D
MEPAAHLDFILAAYGAAAAIVGALIVWVLLDYRAQRHRLAQLEMQGLTRRSAATRSDQPMEQVKEQV